MNFELGYLLQWRGLVSGGEDGVNERDKWKKMSLKALSVCMYIYIYILEIYKDVGYV